MFHNLESRAQHSNLSLCKIAAQDHLFLNHDFHYVQLITSVSNLKPVLDLTTALLNHIRCLSDNSGGSRRKDDSSNLPSDDFKCKQFLANLEHLLRCLQQIALDAIVGHYLKIVEDHILHWHQHWQHQKRACDEWFAEWPNGQRPLSTTWPWNVRPSLLVLWGVCWMFYGNKRYTNQANQGRTTGNINPEVPLPSNENFRTGHIVQQQQPTSAPREYSPTISEFNPITNLIQKQPMPGLVLLIMLIPHGYIRGRQL